MALPASQLRNLPEQFLPEAVTGLDLSDAEHRERARMRFATAMCRDLLAPTLVRVAHLRGIKHARTANGAAYGLASLMIPEPRQGAQ